MINFAKNYRNELFAFTTTFFACFSVFIWSNLRFPNDDQFILFRYIDNIAAGNGFVYNIGEHVLGATTPLFTLIASLFKYILFFIPTPDIVAYLNIIFLSFSSIFFYKVSQRFLSSRWSMVVSIIFALSMAKTIPEGMETPLFLLTGLAFIYYILSGRYYLSSVLLAFTILVRPDAGLIAALAAVYWFQKKGFRTTARLTLLTIAVVLPWLIFATIYFGSFLPQSLVTKTHSHDIYHLDKLQAVKIQMAFLSRMYWGKLFDPSNIPLQILFNLIPVVFLFAFAVLKKLRRDNWIVFAIPFVYLVSFSISNPIIFPWYLSQMEPFWILLSFTGFALIAEKFENRYIKNLLIVVMIFGPLCSWAGLVTGAYKGTKINAFETGAYIKAHMGANDTVGLADIGIVGYTTNAYIVDFIGLVNSTSVGYYPITDACRDKDELYVIPPKLIMDKKPVWLVAGDSSLTKCFREGGWFNDNYDLVYTSQGAKVWKLKEN